MGLVWGSPLRRRPSWPFTRCGCGRATANGSGVCLFCADEDEVGDE